MCRNGTTLRIQGSGNNPLTEASFMRVLWTSRALAAFSLRVRRVFLFGFVVSFAAFPILVAIEPKLTQADSPIFAERKTESLWISPFFYRFGTSEKRIIPQLPHPCVCLTLWENKGDMLHKRAMIVLLTLGTASGCVTAGDEDLLNG